MMKADIGLYVHIPFCISKCEYCDFCSFPSLSKKRCDKYVEALCREILSYKGRKISVNSIFFGGGTPSLLSGDEFEKIALSIREAFSVSNDCEFTIEANPKTLTEENLKKYISLGVNRISIGLQSIHENELKLLGRIHTYADFLESYNLVRKYGIKNVNVDLMYGIPAQTKESFRETLAAIEAISPEHISLYGLMIEEGTPFYRKKDILPLPREDDECDMYYIADHRLAEKGYNHYEISNYSKPGFACRHNLKYWRAEEYIGFGLSAYSYFGGERFGNTSDFDKYVLGNFLDPSSREHIDEDSRKYEYAMLRLRLSEGFSLEEYSHLFGEDFLEDRRTDIKAFSEGGYLKINDGRISLTERGFYVSNSILSKLL